MTDRDMKQPVSEFQKAFIARTKQARESRYTQQEIADLLGISQSRYSKYEIRTPLPHEYIRKFCIATGVRPDWLFDMKPGRLETGAGEA